MKPYRTEEKGQWFLEMAEKTPRYPMPHHCCPFCHKKIGGGMTLVRHLFDAHKIDYNLGNKIVDLIYAEADKNGWPAEFEKILGYDEAHEPLPSLPDDQKQYLDQLSVEIDDILRTLQPTSPVVESPHQTHAETGR